VYVFKSPAIIKNMIEQLLVLLEEHGIIVAFLSGFITGDSMITLLSFLAANGYISLWKVVVFCTLGMYLSEFIPFSIGKIKPLREYFEKKVFSERVKKTELKIHHHAKTKPFLTLIVAKFTYGLSIPTLIYFGYKEILSYKKFALYMIFINLIFVPVLVLVGWLSGKGFNLTEIVLKDVRVALLFLFALFLIIFYLKKWMGQKLIKMQEQ